MKNIVKFLLPQIIIFIIVGAKLDLLFSFIFIFIHESTHVIVAKSMQMNLKEWISHPIGFAIEIDEIEELTSKQKLILYGSGPLINLILALLFYVIYKIAGNEVFILFININLMLGIFNLIPAFPLDGAQIMRIILSKFFLYKEASKITVYSSFVISLVLMGIFIYFIHSFNITFFLSSILIFISTLKEKRNTMYIIMGDMGRKRIRVKKKGYIDTKVICVYYKKELISLLTLIDKNKFNIFYIVDDELEVLAILREDEILNTLKSKGNMEMESFIESNKLQKMSKAYSE